MARVEPERREEKREGEGVWERAAGGEERAKRGRSQAREDRLLAIALCGGQEKSGDQSHLY